MDGFWGVYYFFYFYCGGPKRGERFCFGAYGWGVEEVKSLFVLPNNAEDPCPKNILGDGVVDGLVAWLPKRLKPLFSPPDVNWRPKWGENNAPVWPMPLFSSFLPCYPWLSLLLLPKRDPVKPEKIGFDFYPWFGWLGSINLWEL